MKREIVLKKELFKSGMEFFVEWDKADSDDDWKKHEADFNELMNKVYHLWDSIFTGIDSNAIEYIKDCVVDDDLEEEYLQYSDLERFEKEYLNSSNIVITDMIRFEKEHLSECDEVSGTVAICGLALLKTVCDVVAPWKTKEMLEKLNKPYWDIDDSILDKAVEIYTAYYDKGCRLFREEKEKLGFYEFQKTVDSKWFGLFTTKATDTYVYEMRDAIVEKFYGVSYDLDDVKNLIGSYKSSKEFFFLEMTATLSDICAKMYTAD